MSSFTCFFFFNDTATTEIYTLSLHDALPICEAAVGAAVEGLRERQDLVLVGTVGVVGILAREFDRRLYALGSRVAEEDPVEIRRAAEHLGHLCLNGNLIQIGAVDELACLLLNGPHERRIDRKSTRLNSSHANISY